MSAERILIYASIGLNILTIIFALLTKILKNTKHGTIAQRIYDVLRKVQLFVIDAETHSNYTGTERFDYVMTKMTEYLMTENIKIDKTVITNLIENEIDLSNKVNTAETKREIFFQEQPELVETQETKTEIVVENVSRETN